MMLSNIKFHKCTSLSPYPSTFWTKERCFANINEGSKKVVTNSREWNGGSDKMVRQDIQDVQESIYSWVLSVHKHLHNK